MMNFVFGTVDYVVFCSMLGVSAAIGIYFGFFSKSNKTTDDYLFGGKRMKILPIAISLVASQTSGLAIMALPAEIYSYGVTYLWNPASSLVFVPILCVIVIPIFYENNISNCYEYLEIRFNKATRNLITFTFILNIILMVPVTVFIPALAFTQVTGISHHLINIVVCTICSLYTLLGGIKTVVWTDVVQAMIMISFFILIVISGIYKVGGMEKVLEYAENGGRLNISYSWDPRMRSTAWNTFFGGVFMWIGYIGLTQSCAQRIVSLPTLGHARRAIILAGIFFVISVGLKVAIGIIMFAYYHDCDPIKAGLVSKADKMLPFFVQDILGNIQGMPGIFIACIFSAAMGTMSTALNSLAGVIYFDYVRPFIKHSDQRANFIMKILIAIMGIYCILGGFVVEKITSLFQITHIIFGISGGTLIGVFFLGFLFPRADGKTAVISIVISLQVLMWIIVKTHFRFQSGVLRYTPMPTTTDACYSKYGTNSTVNFINETSADGITTAFGSDAPFSLYDISFYWYKVIGASVVWIVAIPLSFFMPNKVDVKLNPKLYAPFVRRFLPRKLEKPYEEEPLNLESTKQRLKASKENK